MNKLRTLAWGVLASLISIQTAIAGGPPVDVCKDCVQRVPEIDGAGALLAVGLMAGLLILVREKFRRK